MLDPKDPAHGSEWIGRVQAAEEANRFTQALADLRAAFEKHDSRNLELALRTLQEGFASIDRRFAEEARERKAAQRGQLIAQRIAAASLLVAIVAIVVGLLT